MMGMLRPLVGAMAMAGLLAGCASSVKLDDKAPVETRTPSADTTGGAGAGTAPQSQVATVDLSARNAADAASKMPRTVYFDFDSYVVKDEFRPVVEAHAKRLMGNSGQKIMLEGHTDERGGREYNLALGQKRAEAVAKAMALMGAQQAQIEAVSFGKERPAAQGSNEDAWAKNRRVEVKDR